MSALTESMELVETLTFPISNFEDQIISWRKEIDFLEREKDFFLFLLRQSAEYSHLKDEGKIKLMTENIERFSSRRIHPFVEKLTSHAIAVKNNKNGGQPIEKITVMHKQLQRQFQSINKSFRTFKETTFENVEDLVELKII